MRGNRKFCAYLLMTFLFSLCPFGAAGTSTVFAAEVAPWDGTATTEPQKDGDVYLISTGAELAWVAKMVAEDNATYGSASYRQTADIDLGGKAWTPIGTIPEEDNGSDILSLSFKGAYDGGGYTISGLVTDGEARFAGLFGAVVDPGALLTPARAQTASGTVSNVHLRDVSISQASAADGITYVGALAGVNFFGTIENCSVTGVVKAEPTGVNSQVYAGGLVGSGAMGATIADCFSAAEVRVSSAGRIYVGGLAGGASSALRGCFATGDVYAESSGDEQTIAAGGLVGISNAGAELCFAKGDVRVTAAAAEIMAYAGGLIGQAENNATFGSAAMGDVYVSTTGDDTDVFAYAGGFVGLIRDSTLSANFASGSVSVETAGTSNNATPYAGGFIGDNAGGGVIENCFAVGDVLAKRASGVSYGAYAGGFAGRMEVASTIKTSYAYGAVSAEVPSSGAPYPGGFVGDTVSSTVVTDGFWLSTSTINTDLPHFGRGTPTTATVVSLDLTGFATPAKFAASWDMTNVWTFSEINDETRPHLLDFVSAAGVLSGDMARVLPGMIAIPQGETRELRLSAMGWEASADNVGTAADLSAYGLTLTQHETSPDILILTALANAAPASRDIAVTFEVNGIAQTARAIEVVVTAPAGGDPSDPSDFQTVYDGLSDDQKTKLRDGANLILNGAVNPSDLGTISAGDTLTLDVWFLLSMDQGNNQVSWDIDPSYNGEIMTASIYEGANGLALGIGEVWDPNGTLTAFETVSDDVENGLARFEFGKPESTVTALDASSPSRGKALAEGPHFVAVYDDAGKLVLDPMTVTVGDTPPGGHSGSGVGCDAGYAAFGIFGLLPLLPLIARRRR